MKKLFILSIATASLIFVSAQQEKIYKSVKIGTHEWMSENLDVTTYSNGDPIPEVQSPKEWKRLKTGAWCYYENKTENGTIYGKLYNWYAVSDPRGLAPKGWHIPSREEGQELTVEVNGRMTPGVGTKLKSKTGWKDLVSKGKTTVGSGTDTYGFNGLPAGFINETGGFRTISESALWWTATEKQRDFTSFAISLSAYNDVAAVDPSLQNRGYSVRCIKGDATNDKK